MLDDELDYLLIPVDHFHLLFGVLEANVVVNELLFVIELWKGCFERLLDCCLFLHSNIYLLAYFLAKCIFL